MDALLRRARPEDAEACGQICFDAFATINARHGVPPDFPSPVVAQGLLRGLFSHPGFYAVVAEAGGRIAGSNAMDERSTIAGIGPITIDPGAQNGGIGRMLMQDALDRARDKGFPGVRLVQAAFHGRSLSLYAKLGFQVREPLAVMNGTVNAAPQDGATVRPATADDLDACNRICEQVHGIGRAGETAEAIGQGTARVVERDGRVRGYASLIGFSGHAAGETDADIAALIAGAGPFHGPGILVPIRNAALFSWCLESGLRVTQTMNLMTVGLYNEPRGAYLPSILY